MPAQIHTNPSATPLTGAVPSALPLALFSPTMAEGSPFAELLSARIDALQGYENQSDNPDSGEGQTVLNTLFQPHAASLPPLTFAIQQQLAGGAERVDTALPDSADSLLSSRLVEGKPLPPTAAALPQQQVAQAAQPVAGAPSRPDSPAPSAADLQAARAADAASMSVPGEPAPNANPVAQFPHPSLVARRESMPLGAAASSEVLAQANQFDAKAESTAQLAQPSIADAARSEVRSRAFDQVAVQNSVLPEPAGSAVEVGQAQVRGALLNATPAQAAQGAAVAQTVPQPSAEAQIEMALDNPAPVRVDVASDGNRRQPPAAHSRSTLLDPASTSGAADAAGEWASEWLRAAGTDEAPGLQAASTLGRTVGSPQWAEALAGRVQWQAGQGIQRAEIRLDPPELGALEVQIDLSEDGAQIRFGTEHAAAREALDAALPRLRELLSQSGFGEVQVDVGDRQQQSFAETAADSGQSGDEQAGGRGESSAEAANSLSAVANGVPGNRPHGGLTASGGFDAFA